MRATYEDLLRAARRHAIDAYGPAADETTDLVVAWQATLTAARHHFRWLGLELSTTDFTVRRPDDDAVGPLPALARSLGAGADLLATQNWSTSAEFVSRHSLVAARSEVAAISALGARAVLAKITNGDLLVDQVSAHLGRHLVELIGELDSLRARPPTSLGALGRLSTALPCAAVDQPSAIVYLAARWQSAHQATSAPDLLTRDLRSTTAQLRTVCGYAAHLADLLSSSAGRTHDLRVLAGALRTTYLLDGRTGTTKTTVSGLPGSTPNTEKQNTYDPATGLAAVVTAKAADGTTATITTGYDSWGRPTTYQPSSEQITTTVYDAAGRTAAMTDANGSTAYTYDGTDAVGNTERRGLATKVEVTTGGSTWISTGAYDADGSMTIQRLPGGITQINDLDNAGEPVGQRYTSQVTTLNDDGATTVDPNGGWLSWSIENDVTGRVAHEWTPDGAAFTGPSGDAPGDAIPYDRAYTYDAAGRLVQVRDRTAATTGIDITDPTAAPCVTRTYGFDRNDNRLTKASATSGADGACPTTGGSTVARTFDTADRPVYGANGTGGYTYDALGRMLTIPASDAPSPAGGDITLASYDDDLARSITQAGTTTTFALDAADRRSVETRSQAGGSTQTVRHYSDASDNPSWVTTGATVERYAELVGDDLALVAAQDGSATMTIANPHGDVVSTVTLGSPSATGSRLDQWDSFDEYGHTDNLADSTGQIGYGWLGAKQRATDQSGLILMGARLHNPTTGLFASVDPVPDGGANRYAYPTDPVNKFDLDGNKWCWKFCPSKNPLVDSWVANARMSVALVGILPLGKVKWAKRFKQWRKNPWKRLKKTYKQCRREGIRCAASKVAYATGIGDVLAERKNWWRAQSRLASAYKRGIKASIKRLRLHRCNMVCRMGG